MCPTQVVTYQFSGEFGGRLIKGNQDFFGLAGEPFSITLDACESRQPSKRDRTTPSTPLLSGGPHSTLMSSERSQ
jgi:hypothetical protein